MMTASSLHAVQTVFLLLLSVVAAFAVIARKLLVPYPIVLVIGGLLISFLPDVPAIPLSPDLVFFIFLPPLLYAAAWQTSWGDFRRNLPTIAAMAIGLVGFTVWGVAELAGRFIPTLEWNSAFLLGAVVATTDAIAASSIAKRIGFPKRILDLLEGESLVNDATGLLALTFGLQMVETGHPQSVGFGLLHLLWLMIGGLTIGLLLAWVTDRLERWVNDGPVEMTISVIVPYAAYLAGDGLHASGVLSVVACGLYLSRRSVKFYSPETRIQITSGWMALNFIFNGLAFVLIGLQLPNVLVGLQWCSRWKLLQYGLALSAMLIVLRIVWMYPAAAIAHELRTRLLRHSEKKPSAREVFLLGWTGMRGVVALAAAISLPETLSNGEPFRQRDLIVFLTFAVILVTLVLQGLSLPMMIRFLGLASKSTRGEEETEARRTMLQAAIAHLEQGKAQSGESNAHVYDDLLHFYQHMLEAMEAQVQEDSEAKSRAATYRLFREITESTVQAERRALIELRDKGRIGESVMRHLEGELDLTEARQRMRHQ
jgi:monovalent cation/hydrogen antiporter